MDASGAGPYDFVHTKKISSKETLLWASTDAQIIYSKVFHKPLPELQLDTLACEAISKHEDASLYRTENNWSLFECGATLYGFLDNDRRYVNVETIVSKFGMAEKHFSINKKDFLSFCESASQIHAGTSSLPPEITLSCEQDGIALTYQNNTYHRDQYRTLEADIFVKQFDEWHFNGDLAIQLLKSVPYQTLIFSKAMNSYFITSEDEDAEDYVGLINGLAYTLAPKKPEPVSDELPFN